jgi:maltose alpha-D-glucosyltransferase/alpha-amylase
LDYLEDLGVDCLALMPFYPSPLRDDGYDVSDYCNVHPECGTLEQFRRLLAEAQARNIRVVIDVLLNHTSTAHEWFQRARMSPPGSPERDFYVWSDSPERFAGAEVLFSDYESSNWEWDNVAKAYYWHRFYSHQPDLNYDNPLVRSEIRKVFDFWFQLGVDGLRLTSVAFLFQREGTTSENLPEVHQFLRELRQHVDEHYPGKILIAETNLWPEAAAEYLGQGDQCHLNYHYPLMPRMYMALQTEDRYPIVDILEQTPAIPDTTQWALFLRNHDDLTLSMVTEEERDYLYKMLAQDHGARINEGIRRRLAPLLGNDRRKLEIMYLLLFSLPGTPVLYYGDEIGMGDNIYLGDRKGVRTPMQWNGDRNAGFSAANPQKLFLPVISDPQYRYEAVNVELQNRNPASLLWWMKNLIAVRKRNKAFSQGSIRFLNARNSKVIAFVRTFENESLLVIANLSKFSQSVQLDLRDYEGIEPVEVFSQSRFRQVGEGGYTITLGPYGYYWFQLEKSDAVEQDALERAIPELEIQGEWQQVLEQYNYRRQLERRILPGYIRGNRWFGGKSRSAVSFEVNRFPEVETETGKAFLALVDVRYAEGLPDTYFLPLTLVTNAERMVHFLKNEPRSVVCYLKAGDTQGILIDAIYEESFRNELFRLIRNNGSIELPGGVLRFEAGKISDRRAVHSRRSNPLGSPQSRAEQYFGDLQRPVFFQNIPQVGHRHQPRSGIGEIPLGAHQLPQRAPIRRRHTVRGARRAVVHDPGFVAKQNPQSGRSLDRHARHAGPLLRTGHVQNRPQHSPTRSGACRTPVLRAGARTDAATHRQSQLRARVPAGRAHRRNAHCTGSRAERSCLQAGAFYASLSAICVFGAPQIGERKIGCAGR